MKRLLIFILIIISIQSFGQNPGNYTYINGKYRWQAGIFDSTFRLPRYNGVPSGLRIGEWSTMDGALASDTLNGHVYHYWNTVWKRLAYYADLTGRFGVTGEDRIAGQNRTFSGLNHTYSFRFDSLNVFDVYRNGINRLYVNNLSSGLFSPDGLNSVQASDVVAQLKGGSTGFVYAYPDSVVLNQLSGNYSIYNLPQRFDTSANKVMTWNASTLKWGWDYWHGGGGGSGIVNTGAALKAAYYPSGGTTVDDWVGVEFGNTNLNTKITAQAATEVPLEIKLASTPTANALDISSNAGTGDLANISATGKITTVSDLVTTGGDLYIRSSTPAVYIGRDQQVNTYPGIWFGSNAAAPSTTNFSFLYSTPQTTINGPSISGSVLFEVNNDFTNAMLYSTNKYLGIGFAYNGTPVRKLSLADNNSTTNAVVNLMRTTYTSTGTPANGVGIGHEFEIETTAGNNEVGAILESVVTDVTAASEDFDFILKLMAGGAAAAEKFRVKSTGQLNLAAYTSGSISGTPNRYLAAEADGDVIEVAATTLKPSLNKAVTIEAPSSSEAIDMWQTPVAITVTSLKAILRGSSPSVTYNIRFGTDITSSTDVFTANITCTSVTTGCSNNSGFNDATIPAGSFIWVITSASSGTITSISLTLNYTED